MDARHLTKTDGATLGRQRPGPLGFTKIEAAPKLHLRARGGISPRANTRAKAMCTHKRMAQGVSKATTAPPSNSHSRESGDKNSPVTHTNVLSGALIMFTRDTNIRFQGATAAFLSTRSHALETVGLSGHPLLCHPLLYVAIVVAGQHHPRCLHLPSPCRRV